MTTTIDRIPVEAVTEGRRKDTLTAPADHPYGKYEAGDEVAPDRMLRAHLRLLSAETTPSGGISAQAAVAKAELARNKANRAAKKASA